MKFIDEAIITVKSGNGGRGAVSFRHEPYVPRGGPNGGNGGKGGDLILLADAQLATLLDFKYHPHYRAKIGASGGSNDKNGAGAENLVIPVPLGTTVLDADTGEMLADLVLPGQRFLAAKGGRGGRGNTFFKTSSNRAPTIAQPGEPGLQRQLRLELKLIADVGLVGLPNAGKSTLISRISAARPKIADYPFTTLAPQLGVVGAGEGKSFVVADLPGLIEGASAGHGLGHQFLRHIERTRIVLHLLDCQRPEPLQDLKTINRELEAFDPQLLLKPQIAVLTKADLATDPKTLTALKRKIVRAGYETMIVSAATGSGLDQLVLRTAERLAERRAELAGPPPEATPKEEGWKP